MTAPKPDLGVLSFQPLPSDSPPAVRVRMLLKTALRRFGLKCVRLDSDQVRYIAKPKEGREEHKRLFFSVVGGRLWRPPRFIRTRPRAFNRVQMAFCEHLRTP